MREESLIFLISVLFVLLLLGLIYTQVLNYKIYYAQSQNNFIRIVPIDGPRGKIIDRNGHVLVSNRLSLDASCIYQEIGRKDRFINALEEMLQVSSKDIIGSLGRARERPFAPVAVVEDIDKDKAIAIEEREQDLSGLVIEPRSKRHYIYDDAASHVFGYLGEVNEKELEGLKEYGYRMRDLVGRSGLERYYNSYLMGMDGGEQVEVDALGRRFNVLGVKEPVPGKDLQLTIDLRLQLIVDRLLGDKKGAALVMDPRNGEILAMASHPSFDPNAFVKPNCGPERMRLLKGRGKPLLNRAISGLYAPGSVFKIVIAASALETKRISSHTRFNCAGSYSLGNATFGCWKEEGHGSQDIIEAIKNSCNVFFYQAGRAAGVDNIEAYAIRLGFGKPTGIDLPEEASGLVPGRLWKMITKKSAWYEGETLNYSIGQGYLLVTPIQVLRMTSAIANGGKLVRPYIVKRIGSVETGGARLQDTGLSADVINVIKEGMFRVVNDPFGTGKHARVDGLLIGGKTGTAQNPQGRSHAWFTGFAPWKDPKMAVVVLIEHGGKGGMDPAAIARDIFKSAKEMGYL